MSGRLRHPRPRYADGWMGLALAIVEDSANLRGARCVEFVAEFDADRRAEELGYADESERWQTVTAVCRSCPARAACWAWSSNLPVTASAMGPTATSVQNPFPLTHAHRDRAEARRDAQDGPGHHGPSDMGAAS